FLGNRDGGCHGLHVEPPTFELVAESTLVLLEDLDFVLNREVALQELTDHLQIHRCFRSRRGLGHHPSPFSPALSFSAPRPGAPAHVSRRLRALSPCPYAHRRGRTLCDLAHQGDDRLTTVQQGCPPWYDCSRL